MSKAKIKIKVIEAERGYILTANGCKYHLGTYLEKDFANQLALRDSKYYDCEVELA